MEPEIEKEIQEFLEKNNFKAEMPSEARKCLIRYIYFVKTSVKQPIKAAKVFDLTDKPAKMAITASYFSLN